MLFAEQRASETILKGALMYRRMNGTFYEFLNSVREQIEGLLRVVLLQAFAGRGLRFRASAAGA